MVSWFIAAITQNYSESNIVSNSSPRNISHYCMKKCLWRIFISSYKFNSVQAWLLGSPTLSNGNVSVKWKKSFRERILEIGRIYPESGSVCIIFICHIFLSSVLNWILSSLKTLKEYLTYQHQLIMTMTNIWRVRTIQWGYLSCYCHLYCTCITCPAAVVSGCHVRDCSSFMHWIQIFVTSIATSDQHHHYYYHETKLHYFIILLASKSIIFSFLHALHLSISFSARAIE